MVRGRECKREGGVITMHLASCLSHDLHPLNYTALFPIPRCRLCRPSVHHYLSTMHSAIGRIVNIRCRIRLFRYDDKCKSGHTEFNVNDTVRWKLSGDQ